MSEQQKAEVLRQVEESVAQNFGLREVFDALSEIDAAWEDWDVKTLIRIGRSWADARRAAIQNGDGKRYRSARYLAREAGESIGEIIYKIRRVQREVAR